MIQYGMLLWTGTAADILPRQTSVINTVTVSFSGRPHAPGLLQRFVWRRHQPGVSSPLSVPMQRGHNGECDRTILIDCPSRDSHDLLKHDWELCRALSRRCVWILSNPHIHANQFL